MAQRAPRPTVRCVRSSFRYRGGGRSTRYDRKLWPSATPGSSPANPSEKRCLGVGTTGTGITEFKGTPFIHGQAAPHAVVLVGIQGPSQAGVSDTTAAADDSCFVDLVKRGVGVPNREEQLW